MDRKLSLAMDSLCSKDLRMLKDALYSVAVSPLFICQASLLVMFPMRRGLSGGRIIGITILTTVLIFPCSN